MAEYGLSEWAKTFPSLSETLLNQRYKTDLYQNVQIMECTFWF